jgi:hypothetical protein
MASSKLVSDVALISVTRATVPAMTDLLASAVTVDGHTPQHRTKSLCETAGSVPEPPAGPPKSALLRP